MTTVQIPSTFEHVIPFGTTEPQDFALRHNGGQAIDLTGIDVELEIYRKVSGDWTLLTLAMVDPLPTVEILGDAENGNVRVTGVEILPIANYRVRFRLTDSSDEVGYCPNGAVANVWRVVAIAA